MSTKPASNKSKTSSKSATKTKPKTATKPKSRLAGPKPPKARASVGKAKTVSKVVTTTRVEKKEKAEKPTMETPVLATAKEPAVATPSGVALELKKRELIELVVAKSDIKKKYAKPVVEALLEVIGDTLAAGREMNLQPMGKVKYNRSKETASARVVIAKIRQNKAASKFTTPQVADAAEGR